MIGPRVMIAFLVLMVLGAIALGVTLAMDLGRLAEGST